MATIREVCELFTRLPDGGVVDSTDRWDIGYMQQLAIDYRAKLAVAVYGTNKRLHPSWYQKHYPVYEPLLQDDLGCNVKFRHPEILALDDRSDGFRYIGSLDCNNNFARIQSRAWLSTFNDNKTTTINTRRRTSVLYDGNAQILEIYGDPEIEQILTESLLADPRSIPTYNSELDEFPMPESLISDLVGMVFNENLSTELRIPVGYHSVINTQSKRGR